MKAMMPMSPLRRVATVASLALWVHPSVARAQATDMEPVYQAIDGQADLTLAQKYERKMEVLTASLAAGDAYVSAFEDLTSAAAIVRETGGVLQPGFGKKLEEFQARLQEATENRAFSTFGKLKTASGYASQAVGLVSEADAILGDSNLTPSARRSLLALRGFGAAMQTLGEKLPGIGAGLEMYGEMVGELTAAVRVTGRSATALKGGSFSLAEERELGLAPGHLRTSLYERGFPLVQEIVNEKGAERTYLKTEDRGWVEVPYEEVSAIWCEYRFVNDKGPTPAEVTSYLGSPELRQKLAQRARFRAEDQHADALIAGLGVSGVSRARLRRTEEDLRETLRRLGLMVAPSSSAFKNLLREQLADPHGNDALLKRLALAAHPRAREYFAWLGVDPDGLSLEELSTRLIEYRSGGYRRFADALKARESGPPVVKAADVHPSGGQASPPPSPAPVATPAPGPRTAPAATVENPAVLECTKDARERLASAERTLAAVRSPNQYPSWSCQAMSMHQQAPPPACCEQYYKTRNNPGMWDESWAVLQECGWRAEIDRRRQTLAEAEEACRAKTR